MNKYWNPAVSIDSIGVIYTSINLVWIVNHTIAGVPKILIQAKLDSATQYHKLTIL